MSAVNLEDLQTYDFEYVSKIVGRSVRWLNENADTFEHIDCGRRRRMTAKQIEKFMARHVGGVDTSTDAAPVERKSPDSVLLDVARVRRARKTSTPSQRRGAA